MRKFMFIWHFHLWPGMHAPPRAAPPQPWKNGCQDPENCQPAWAKLSSIICVVYRTWPVNVHGDHGSLRLRWSPRCHNLPSSSPAVVSSRPPSIVVLFTIRFCSSNNEVNNLVVIAIRELVGTKMDNFHDYIGILQGLQHLLSGWPHVTRNSCSCMRGLCITSRWHINYLWG